MPFFPEEQSSKIHPKSFNAEDFNAVSSESSGWQSPDENGGKKDMQKILAQKQVITFRISS